MIVGLVIGLVVGGACGVAIAWILASARASARVAADRECHAETIGSARAEVLSLQATLRRHAPQLPFMSIIPTFRSDSHV